MVEVISDVEEAAGRCVPALFATGAGAAVANAAAIATPPRGCFISLILCPLCATARLIG